MDNLTIPDAAQKTTMARNQTIGATFSAIATTVGAAFQDLLFETTVTSELWRAPTDTLPLASHDYETPPKFNERSDSSSRPHNDREDRNRVRNNEPDHEIASSAEAPVNDRVDRSPDDSHQKQTYKESEFGAREPATNGDATDEQPASNEMASSETNALADLVPTTAAMPQDSIQDVSSFITAAAPAAKGAGTTGQTITPDGASDSDTKNPTTRATPTENNFNAGSGAVSFDKDPRLAANPDMLDTGDASQGQKATPNKGSAADPRLAQVNFSVTKEADILQSSPVSTLTAAAAQGNSSTAAPNQQSKTKSNTATGVQPGAAANLSVAQVTTAATTPSPSSPQSVNPVASSTDGGAGRSSLPSPGNTPTATNGAATPTDAASERPQGQFVDELKAKDSTVPPSRKPTIGDQVSVHITKAIKNGIDRINIQLKPQSLGRVDIQLELAADGRVTATVTADSRQAFDLLQQDARELEQALQQAGLKADSNSLSFNLRGQNDSHNPRTAAGDATSASDETDSLVDADDDMGEIGSGPDRAGSGRLDIRA